MLTDVFGPPSKCRCNFCPYTADSQGILIVPCPRPACTTIPSPTIICHSRSILRLYSMRFFAPSLPEILWPKMYSFSSSDRSVHAWITVAKFRRNIRMGGWESDGVKLSNSSSKENPNCSLETPNSFNNLKAKFE